MEVRKISALLWFVSRILWKIYRKNLYYALSQRKRFSANKSEYKVIA